MSELMLPLKNGCVHRENIRSLNHYREELRGQITQLRETTAGRREAIAAMRRRSNGKSTSDIRAEENLLAGLEGRMEKLRRAMVKNRELIDAAKDELSKTHDITFEQFFQQVVFDAVDEGTYMRWKAEALERFKEAFELKDELDEPPA